MDKLRLPVKSVSCDGVSEEKVLYLRKKSAQQKGGDCFKIHRVLGEGASCICYEATLVGENKTGRLKEFYPYEALQKNAPFLLERNETNHIVSTESCRENFMAARKEFVEPYQLLQDTEKQKNDSDFTNFIPDFTIYEACDENGEFVDGSTAYIWTAPKKLTVFEDYIKDVHRHPYDYPEHYLFKILSTVLTLTECVRIMHEKGLLHLDIKPGNFGIPKRKNKLLTDTVTMFDVDTLYSIESSLESLHGTKGFSAPEVACGWADNRSDIYSIGCTLFSALMTSSDGELMGYSKEYYHKLPEMLEDSRLISALSNSTNISLKYELVDILRKCLAELPDKRYQSCVDLVNDIEIALAYLYPAEINKNLSPEKQLALLDKKLDPKKNVSSYLTFLYHLYKHPLFEYAPMNRDSIDVLIVGFGNYGQNFLDCCLQVGQVYGKKLNIHVVSCDSENTNKDKEIYLAARPALKEFFSIDGDECRDAYGRITFECQSFVRDDAEKNQKTVEAIAAKGQYVFVALGDTLLNKKIANAFKSCESENEKRSIQYAYDGIHKAGYFVSSDGVNPVFMQDDITKEGIFQDLERMAFNAHLIWERGLNIDFEESRSRFKEPYNYNSSFANVVSIKYKLYSFGIDLQDAYAAAIEYDKKVDTNSQKIRRELIALEHQRWVCEKISLGWVGNKYLESCVTGQTNDKNAKRHICLVKSTSAAPLLTEEWTKEKWDDADENDLAQLDELDCMSVRLHQIYKKAADHLKKEGRTLLNSQLIELKAVLKKSEAASVAFSEWNSCLQLLLSDKRSYAREYATLRRALNESIVLLGEEDANAASKLMEIIDSQFDIILKSMEYKNFKQNDKDLVDCIPFILTYRENIHLAIPFACGNNTEIFGNVASATIVNPAKISYLFHIDQMNDVSDFKEAVQYVLNYMDEKKVASKIDFLITHRKDDEIQKSVEQLKTDLLKKGTARIQTALIGVIENESDIPGCFAKWFGHELQIDAIEKNETPLSRLLETVKDQAIYSEYPYYCFDMNTRRFSTQSGCEFLGFIKAEQYLKISDMFASKNSKGYREAADSFYHDYEGLWQKAYRRDELAWKKACTLLKAYHQKEDVVVTIDRSLVKENDSVVKYRCLLPAAAYEGVGKIVSALVNEKVFGAKSEVYYYTTDSCEVTIYASEVVINKMKPLLANPDLLCRNENIEIAKNDCEIVILFDYLTVRLDLGCEEAYGKPIKELLQLLEKEFSFIIGYNESGDANQFVRFAYATKRVKLLLTNVDKILEIYIYHKCLTANWVNDIAANYGAGSEDGLGMNIILTNGFSGLMIEANVADGIETKDCGRLSSVVDRYGINCKKIYVVDGAYKQPILVGAEDIEDIILIWDSKAIDEIDKTLEGIAKN